MGIIKKSLYENIVKLQKSLLKSKQENEKLKRAYDLDQKKKLLSLIEFCDNYENVIKSFGPEDAQGQVNIRKSLKRIKVLKKKYDRILASMGAALIETHKIDHANIDCKQVLVAEVIENKKSSNNCATIEVLKNGYLFNDEVLRPVEVIISYL